MHPCSACVAARGLAGFCRVPRCGYRRMCCGSVRNWPSRSPSFLPKQGGLNLRSGVALAPAAYWESWADTLPVLHRQLPTLAGEILARLRAQEPAGPALSGVLQAQDTAGFRPPSWEEPLDNPAPLDLSGHLPEPRAALSVLQLPLARAGIPDSAKHQT